MNHQHLALGALFAAVAAVAVGGPALAQVSPQGLAGPAAGAGTGRYFNAQLSVLVEHDTNIARTSDALAELDGVTPEDTLYAPTLNLNLVQPFGRQAVFLNGTASYIFHDKNTRLNDENLNLSGGFAVNAGICHAVVDGGYARGRNELAGPETTALGPTSPTQTGTTAPVTTDLQSTVFNIETTEQVGVSSVCGRPSGLGVIVNAGQQWVTNSVVFSSRSDYESRNVGAGLTYRRPQFGQLSLIGSYSRTDNGDLTTTSLLPKGFESYGANLAFTRQLGGRIQLTATVGYTHAHELSPPPLPAGFTGAPPPSEFSGLTYSGGVTFRVSSRLSTRATFQRQIQPSVLSGGSYEVATGYLVGADYQIGSHFTVGLSGTRQESVSNGVIILPGALALTNSTVNDLSASITYIINQRLSLRLSGDVENRTANNSQFNYNNDRVALHLSAKL